LDKVLIKLFFMTTTKIIVFDLDGVLIDSEEANYQAFAYGI